MRTVVKKHITNRRSFLATGALCIFVVAGTALAQEITGSIAGIVTDTSGGYISGAPVNLRNVQTGVAQTFLSDDRGGYRFSLLPVGEYEVSISLQGFKRFVEKGIVLHVNDKLVIDIRLEVGTIGEEVTVTASPAAVQTESSEVSGLISGKQVLDLPLNNRSFVQLTTLVPGVTDNLSDEQTFGLTNTVAISVSGGRTSSVNWLVDGASNVDVGSNLTLLSVPTVDSIAEFKILTNSYNAEFGRNGGGVVNVVTRGGTKIFHGGVYEFFRNDALNANSFFNNLRGRNPRDGSPRSPVPRLRYHNFGWNLGGPVYIPHFYNLTKEKTFFFFSQEFRRISRGTTRTATVPSRAQRNGDFSATTTDFVDPTTNLPFEDRIIPQDRIDRNARNFLQLFPLPNFGATQLISNDPEGTNTEQETVRVDHNFSPRMKMTARFTRDVTRTREAGGLFNNISIPGIATTKTNTPGRTFILSVTNYFSPSLINEFSYNLSGNHIESTLIGRSQKSDLDIVIPKLFPSVVDDRIPFLNITGFATIGVSGPFDIKFFNHALKDDLTKIAGTHAFKAGFISTIEGKNENSGSLNRGQFFFNGTRTRSAGALTGGLPLADFLLGLASSYVEDERDIKLRLRFHRFEFYGQDAWRLHRRLTFNYGLRYSMYRMPVEKSNVLTSFFPSRYDPARAPQFSSSGTVLVRGTGDPLNGIIRAGVNSPFGSRVQSESFNNVAPRLGIAWDPVGKGRTALRAGYGIYYDQTLVGIVEENAFRNPPFNNRATLNNVLLRDPTIGTLGALLPVSLVSTDEDFKVPTVHHWSFGLQHEVFKGHVLEVTYVGTTGTHLLQQVDINQAHPADVVRIGTDKIHTVRPFRGYATISNRQTTALSRYHGLLVSLNRQFAKGFSIQSSYTWSKNMTTSSTDRTTTDNPQNSRDLRAERAPARFTDRPHVFTTNSVWEVPLFKEARPWVKTLLGGWQMSVIATFQAGLPLTITEDTLSGTRGNRPNLIGDPNDNIPASGLYHFNPAAFSPAPAGTFGNAGRGVVRGPGRSQWDISLMRNFRVKENVKLQFRGEFFNAFNHTQFSTVETSTAATANIGKYTGTRRPREIQFALKLNF